MPVATDVEVCGRDGVWRILSVIIARWVGCPRSVEYTGLRPHPVQVR